MLDILKAITERYSLTFVEYSALSGGDINQVFLLKCKEKNIVVKLNNAAAFPSMFDAEAKGLKILASSDSFIIPHVIAVGQTEDKAYILLEHIASVTKSNKFWSLFAEHLAKLHKTTQPTFGLDHDNYIGSLKQYNSPEVTAADFYLNQRLIPQFRMAVDQGFPFKNLNAFYSNVLQLIPNEAPALVHGDLWNGNYMVSKMGLPVLIDPAVAFAPREMDLAMMRLFGGFPNEVFSTYNEIFPLEEDWESRIPLYQLYYLLVHLNLFGSGYLNQVETILRKFS